MIGKMKVSRIQTRDELYMFFFLMEVILSEFWLLVGFDN